jgi:hypothetical protein
MAITDDPMFSGRVESPYKPSAPDPYSKPPISIPTIGTPPPGPGLGPLFPPISPINVRPGTPSPGAPPKQYIQPVPPKQFIPPTQPAPPQQIPTVPVNPQYPPGRQRPSTPPGAPVPVSPINVMPQPSQPAQPQQPWITPETSHLPWDQFSQMLSHFASWHSNQ